MSWESRAALDRFNYYNDPRTVEAMRDRAWTVLAAGPDVAIIRPCEWLTDLDDDDGEQLSPLETAYEVRARFAVCWLCGGSGKTANPAIDCGGLGREDFDADPDFAEAYYRGAFDVTCDACNGKRVTLDEEAALNSLPADVRERLIDAQRDIDADLAERLAEARYGC